MATKLSQLLEQAGLTIDDIEDDELNLPVAEVRKRLKENQSGYSKATAAVKERDAELAKYQASLKEWQDYGNTLRANQERLEQQIAQRAEQVQQQGGDWRRDPIFMDMVGDFDRISAGVKDSQDATTALSRGMHAFATKYVDDRKAVVNFIDRVEKRFTKMDHPDFDADAVDAWARENGVQDTWENAYLRMKAADLPAREKEIEDRARAKVLEEHGDKLREPVATEMGSGGARSMPTAGEGKKEYKDAWSGLADQFANINRGRT